MVFDILKRLFSNPKDGIIGKIRQFTSFDEPPTRRSPDAAKVLPRRVLDHVDVIPKAQHQGTIGTIYVGNYKGQKVAIKVVLRSTASNMESDISAFETVGKLAGMIFSHVPVMIHALCSGVGCETDLNRERDMCRLVQEKVAPQVDTVDFIRPVLDFMTVPDVFVYNYITCENLRTVRNTYPHEVLEKIGYDIGLAFFKSIYDCHVLFGDMNPGNFLYDNTTQRVTFIDYGCVFKLSNKQIAELKQLHVAQKSRKSLRNYLKTWNAPKLLADTIYDDSQIFWNPDHIPSDRSFSDILQIPEVASCKLPPQIIMVLRATYQLIDLIRWLGVSCVLESYLSCVS